MSDRGISTASPAPVLPESDDEQEVQVVSHALPLPKTGVCLVMIVRDEEAVIGRALASAWPHVAAWCIVDNGSSDRTKAVVDAWVAEHPKPGYFLASQWHNFGVNRTEALALARAHFRDTCAWLLMMDADDSLHVAPGVTLDAFAVAAAAPGGGGAKVISAAAGCGVTVDDRACSVLVPSHNGIVAMKLVVRFSGGVCTYRMHLFSTAAPWGYVGAVHECAALRVATAADLARLHVVEVPEAAAFIEARSEGVRSRNPRKYEDDARMLEAEFAADPGNMRAAFYAAQSWRDAGQPQAAVALYAKCAHCPRVWAEERYVSCLNVVRLTPSLDVAQEFARLAAEVQPKRREAAYAYFQRLRNAETDAQYADLNMDALFSQALVMGAAVDAAADRTCRPEFLFGEEAVYSYWFDAAFAYIDARARTHVLA